ncbi:hypothetical protein D3C84_631710 [compost metagenome]
MNREWKCLSFNGGQLPIFVSKILKFKKTVPDFLSNNQKAASKVNIRGQRRGFQRIMEIQHFI